MKTLVRRGLAYAMDGVMYGMMNAIQRRRGLSCTSEELRQYIAACDALDREEFYRCSPPPAFTLRDNRLTWSSPVTSGYAGNDLACVDLFPGPRGFAAPTVILLHALMSASDTGYRRIARWFNERGWNAAFPHLPYHYSRTPAGHFNGELAVTADLVLIGETLRQGVTELRQLMAWLRGQGAPEFGLLGTSYGGWTGALLSFVERDLRFVGLLQPIADLETAIWRNPGSRSLRRLLARNGIPPGETAHLAHLTSPSHGIPLCGPERAIIVGGRFDAVSPLADLEALHAKWPGSELAVVDQGHFGFAAMREMLARLEPRLAVAP